jgi:predicted O-methyltransferase YrrM
VTALPDGPPDTAANRSARSEEEVLESIAGVEGWLSDDQARRLWRAANLVRAPGRIVEIGSFRGRSTIVLASAARDGVEVVAVDPHGGGDRGPQEYTPDPARGQEDFEAFKSNLVRAGVRPRVRHVRAASQDALGVLSGELDLLYVDGAHRYRPASADISRWGDRVGTGGSMLVHDSYNAIGVMLAQLRLLVPSRSWRYIGRSGSLAEYRRERLSGPQLWLNAVRQLGGLPYFARNMLIKLMIVARLGRLTWLLGNRSGEWPY